MYSSTLLDILAVFLLMVENTVLTYIDSVVTNSPSNYLNSIGNSVTFSLFKIVFQELIGDDYSI